MYILFIVIILSIILYYNTIYKKKIQKEIDKEIIKIRENYIQENKQFLESQIREQLAGLQAKKREVDLDIQMRLANLQGLRKNLDEINEQIRKQKEQIATYEKDQRALADERIIAYEADKRAIADAKVILEAEEKQRAAGLAFAEQMAEMGARAEQSRAQIEQLQKEIEEYTAKQAAINEAIRRQREIEEQQDFYRICLAEETANDVDVLNNARRNLKKPEIIDKIIYDNYIAKPVLEMIKRVLQNESFSGIYKITCIKTGEIYIGKSTDIKSRWQQHCKSAFNCGTIAHSLLHTKMKQHGIENFTFEVVEKCSKDLLTNREKFYINFYQTKETGLNERNG